MSRVETCARHTVAAPLALVVVALVAASTPARAQTPDSTTAFVVDAYEPGALPTFDLLGLARSRVPSHLVPTFGVQLGYVHSLVEIAQDANPRAVDATLVEHRVRADVVFALGLFDRFAVGLTLPFVLDQAGADLSLLNQPGALTGAAFGDLRLSARGHLFEAAGFGMALGVDLYLPTGNGDAFMSYGDFRVRPVLAVDWHDDSGLGVVVDVGWSSVPATYAHNLVIDDGFTWGVGLDMPTPAAALGVLAAVYGTVPLASGREPSGSGIERDDDRASPIELVASLELALGPDIEVGLGGGAGLSRGIGASSWRGFVDVSWSPEPEVVRDRDGDGLADLVDRCPEEPEDLDLERDDDGCPDPDNDGDGVPDADDGSPDATGYGSCRNEPEDRDGFFDSDGCSEPDNDADGFPDVRDGPRDATGFGACRDKAEDLDGQRDDDGCPELDNDEDGVPDVADGPPDANGFGVCRDAPETKNGYRDDDGCPDDVPKRVRVTQFQIEILETIYFQYDRAIIKPESFPILDEVARVLGDAPELTRVQVEGHTDANGNALYNERLSQRRAEAVADYLVAQGVAPQRLVAKGFGKSRPLVTGPAARTARGRALNRRVEFVIVEVNGTPHASDKPVVIDRPVAP